jgi:energy-coupling factor transport system permease protein
MSVAVANYLNRDTWVHRLNPLTKLFWSLLMMALSFLFRDPLVLALLFMSIVFVAHCARILPEMFPVFKGLAIFPYFSCCFRFF